MVTSSAVVGSEQLGGAGDGHGDHHPLLHAAGELKGILTAALGGRLDADLGQHLLGLFHGLFLAGPGVEAVHVRDLAADGHEGIQRRHRVLEDHGDVSAPHLLDLPVGEGEQFLALEADASPHPAALGVM